MGIADLTYGNLPYISPEPALSEISDYKCIVLEYPEPGSIRIDVLAGAVIFLILVFLIRNLVVTRRLLMNREQLLQLVRSEKGELEQKNRNLTDSLIYAQRIQEALLPSETYFRSHFSDSFIFFRPCAYRRTTSS